MSTPTEHICMKLSISGFALEELPDGSIKAWPRGQDPESMHLTVSPLPTAEKFVQWYGGLKGTGVEKNMAVARRYITGVGKWRDLKTRAFLAHNLAQWIAEGLE